MSFLKDLFNRKPAEAKVDLTRRFDLVARVGQGSMSRVWRARDTMTGKIVALKVLDVAKTIRLEQRFVGLDRPNEGTVAVTLKHPHIVQTFEHGVSVKDEQFLVMEFVEGVGLGYLIDMQNEVMRENRLQLIIQLGSALEYFHKENWIHRDLCPRNVLVDRENQIKLIDFGLVVPNTADFQKPGNRTGTPNYMAPELIKRQKTDQRIDVFAYATTCFEMFTKRLPWDAAETLETVMQHINTPPADIRELVDDIDEQVAETIMRGLERNPKDRWATITRMLVQFRKALARLNGEEELEPEIIEPVAKQNSKVKYWVQEDEDDEDDGFEEAALFEDPDDDEYEEAELLEEAPPVAPKKVDKPKRTRKPVKKTKASKAEKATGTSKPGKAKKSSKGRKANKADKVSEAEAEADDDDYEDADAYFED
jgi:eukaryotic-like serine/threonine-protein kinase